MILGHSESAPLNLVGESRLAIFELPGRLISEEIIALAQPPRFDLPLSVARALAERGERLRQHELKNPMVPYFGWFDSFNGVIYRAYDVESVRSAMDGGNMIVPLDAERNAELLGIGATYLLPAAPPDFCPSSDFWVGESANCMWPECGCKV